MDLPSDWSAEADRWMSCISQGKSISEQEILTVTIASNNTRMVFSLSSLVLVSELRDTVQAFFGAAGARFFYVSTSASTSSSQDETQVKCTFFFGESETASKCKVVLPSHNGSVEKAVEHEIRPAFEGSRCTTLNDMLQSGGRSWDDSLVVYVQLFMGNGPWSIPTVFLTLPKPSEYTTLSNQLLQYVQRLQPTPAVS